MPPWIPNEQDRNGSWISRASTKWIASLIAGPIYTAIWSREP